jgi:hypothetical protein
MKKLFFMAGLVLLVAACSKESENMVNNAQMEVAVAPVKVHVSGFSVAQEDYPTTRAAQDVADYNGVKVVTLAFYNGSTEVYKHEQVRGALEEGETLGEFDCSLPMGSYTMVVIARGLGDGDVFTLTSPTEAAYTSDHSRETFAYTQAVNITSTSAVDISATLNRIIAKLQVLSSDGRAANATNVRMTFAAGGKAFNPTTGLATSNTGFVNTVPISTAAGVTSNSISYLFLAGDEQTMNVTIETLDGEGNTLFSKTVNNVPFKRNRVTILTGAMYTNEAASGAFQLETAWLSNYNGNF